MRVCDWLRKNRITHSVTKPDGTETVYYKKMIRGVEHYLSRTTPPREGEWPNWERDTLGLAQDATFSIPNARNPATTID